MSFFFLENVEETKLVIDGQFSLHSFCIKRVLEKGSYLFAAGENQFELDEDNNSKCFFLFHSKVKK